MSQAQSESSAKSVPRGVPYPISREYVEEYWDAVEGHLRIMEAWSLCISTEQIRLGIESGALQLWSVIDHADKVALAFTRIDATPRGLVCILWLVASSLADDASIFALVDEIEVNARGQGCVALAVNAPPFWADRIKGKMVAVVFERDLRNTLRAN